MSNLKSDAQIEFERKYDRLYFATKHGTGVRVVELTSGRRGIVESIREGRHSGTLDTYIRWDSGELSESRFDLIREETLNEGEEV